MTHALNTDLGTGRYTKRTCINATLDHHTEYISDFKPFPELPSHHAMTVALRDAASICEAKGRSFLNTHSDKSP